MKILLKSLLVIFAVICIGGVVAAALEPSGKCDINSWKVPECKEDIQREEERAPAPKAKAAHNGGGPCYWRDWYDGAPAC